MKHPEYLELHIDAATPARRKHRDLPPWVAGGIAALVFGALGMMMFAPWWVGP